jgi:hypothetical protein
VHHGGYADRYRAAEDHSRAMGLVYRPLPTPTSASDAFTLLPIVARAVNSYPYDSLQIRLQCAAIHLTLFDDPRWNSPCVLTLGDVEVEGEPEYGTTYDALKREFRPGRRTSKEPLPCHVWLTFPDLHIVDVTFFVYRFYDRIPHEWNWGEYLVCSDPRHAFAADLPLTYKPMLLGRQAVAKLVE